MKLNWSKLLTNINNISDIKSIISKILAALDTKANLSDLEGLGVDAVTKSQIGVANGVAPLGSDVKVPSVYLPSYVDDVIEFSSLSTFPSSGETGKIYVADDKNKIYRWSGSSYIEISSAGIADTALKLYTPRTISLTGYVTGSAAFDGSANITIATTGGGGGSTDVLMYANSAAFPTTGANGIIYVAQDTNITYRWNTSTTTYVQIGAGSGTATSAAKLTTARTIAATGDATWSVNFDGSANVSSALTLANSGVTAGTYPKVTVDAKGRVTAGATLLASDIPTLNQNTTGNAATASKWATARNITLTGSVTGTASIDGSGDVTITTTGSGGGGGGGMSWSYNNTAPNTSITYNYLSASAADKNVALALVPKGTGGFSLAIPDGTAVGGNARGNNAVDLQLSRTAATQVASGSYSFVAGQNNTVAGIGSFAAGIGNNVSAGYSFAAGIGNNVSAGYSFAVGNFNTITASSSFSAGTSNTSSGYYSATLGQGNIASGTHTLALGKNSSATQIAEQSHSGGQFSTQGDNQNSRMQLGVAATAANTTYTLTADVASAGTSNQLPVPVSTFVAFKALVTAKQSAAGGTNVAAWEITGKALRGAAGNVALVDTPTVTAIGATVPSGWVVSVVADTVNQAVSFQFNMGATAMNVRANARVEWVKLVYS